MDTVIKVCMGHGKPGKTWNLSGKSWNLSVGHGKPWKMISMYKITCLGSLFACFFANKVVKHTQK